MLLREWDAGQASSERRDDRAATHLQRAKSFLREHRNPLDLIPADANEAQLGLWTAFWAAIQLKPLHEVLRLALERLISDQRFEVTYEDETFKRLNEKVGADVQFLITGHTHFERAIVRPSNKSREVTPPLGQLSDTTFRSVAHGSFKECWSRHGTEGGR